MNKEVLKTKNFNNFALVSVNSDQSLFVKKYYELFKYKLHPNKHTLEHLQEKIQEILHLMDTEIVHFGHIGAEEISFKVSIRIRIS